MEMKEKKADLEQLLNSLIEKGWKPRWYEWVAFYIENKVINWLWWWKTTFRELVSKESWLWQFVCENCLQVWEFNNRERNGKDLYTDIYYEYRLIESALKDESELEDFLLNSIKLD